MRRVAVLAVLAAVALVGAAPAAPAPAADGLVRVGVADNFPETFADPGFARLGVKRTRYALAWNTVDDESRLLGADLFLQAAARAGVKVLLHFTTDDYTPGAARLPSREEYRAKVGALVARYWPLGVREFGVFNEANHRTQPTHAAPERAAQFFQELWRVVADRRHCGPRMPGCRVIALDVLDGRARHQRAATRSYIRHFYGALTPGWRARARYVGLHNYSDTNRRSTGGTRNVRDEVRRWVARPRLWLTETGGVVKLGETGDLRCSPDDPLSVRAAELRARDAVSWMFRLALRFRRDVDRLYVYQYTGADCQERFDAGLVRRDRSRRPAWFTVFRAIRDSPILNP